MGLDMCTVLWKLCSGIGIILALSGLLMMVYSRRYEGAESIPPIFPLMDKVGLGFTIVGGILQLAGVAISP
jgi:hypothetical protein